MTQCDSFILDPDVHDLRAVALLTVRDDDELVHASVLLSFGQTLAVRLATASGSVTCINRQATIRTFKRLPQITEGVPSPSTIGEAHGISKLQLKRKELAVLKF